MSESAAPLERRWLLLGLTIAGFTAFGLSDAQLGTAWPALSSAFNQPVDALGILIGSGMTGLLVGSLLSGWLAGRIGLEKLLAAGALLRGMGLLGFAVGWTWWLVIATAFVSGLGAGVIASSSNTLLANYYGPRWMSWMHASFGLGSAFGPLIMTSVLNAGKNYPLAYLIVGLLELALAGIIVSLNFHGVGRITAAAAVPRPSTRANASVLLGLPIAVFGVLAFFLYRGLEITAGQWMFTLFTGSRAASIAIAGMSVSFYWAGLTAGRVLFGIVAKKLPVYPLLRAAAAGSLVGIALLAMNLSTWTSLLGLALFGFTMAPIFPTLSANTPYRVGALLTPLAMGFQLAMGSLGGAVIPGIAGVLGSKIGLESIATLLIVVCILMYITVEIMSRIRPQNGVIQNPMQHVDSGV